MIERQSVQGVNYYNEEETERFRYTAYRRYNRTLAEKMYKGEAEPRPLHIIIETSSRCNLKCGFCNREAGLARPQQDMDFETFKRIADQASELRVHSLSLYALGEPMLNKEIGKMIIYAKDLGIPYVDLSTNGMYGLKKLIGTGLDELIISVDGDRKTHEELREGADYDRIKDNITEFLDARYNFKGRKIPRVRMQMIDIPKTHDLIEDYKKRWGKKADVVYIKSLEAMSQNLDDKNLSKEEIEKRIETRVPCKQLYFVLTVTSKGDISACCHDPQDKSVLGNIKDMTLEEAWKKLKPIRERHAKGDYFDFEGLCMKCVDWRW